MEFIRYDSVLADLPLAMNDEYVQTAILIVAWEAYVLGKGSIPQDGWYPLLRDHNIGLIVEFLHSYHGTSLSHMFLAYTILRITDPDTPWQIQTRNTYAILRSGNKVVRDSILHIAFETDPYEESKWKRICNVFDVMDVQRLKYRIDLNSRYARSYSNTIKDRPSYNRDAIFNRINRYMPTTTHQAIETMMEDDNDIMATMNKYRLDPWFAYSVLLYKLFPLYEVILVDVPPLECRNKRPSQGRIPFPSDINIFFQ